MGDPIVVLHPPHPHLGLCHLQASPDPHTQTLLETFRFLQKLCVCAVAKGKSHLPAHNPGHISKHVFLKWGRGAPAPSLPSPGCVHHPFHPAPRTHRMRTRTQRFPKPPSRPRHGTRPPGLTPQTAPDRAMRTCQRCRRATLRGDSLTRTYTAYRQGAAHFGDSHALQNNFFFFYTQLPKWTLQTRPTVLSAISLPSHGPAGTNDQHTSVSPYPRELWSDINHRSQLNTHPKNHAHSNTTAHTQRSRGGPHV